MWIRKGWAVALLAGTCGLAGAAQPSVAYTVTRLAASASEGFAINNGGAFAGAAQFADPGMHAFLSTGTDPVDLRALGDTANFSIANHINDRLQVVGTSNYAGGIRGFIYENGVLRDVNVYLPANTSATGNNNAGFIVGAYQLNGAPPRGYLRAPDGSFRDIGTLPFIAPFTLPEAINGRGQIVGGSGPYTRTAALAPRAFLYQNGVMLNLSNLGADPSVAKAINDRGEATGYSSLRASGVFHAALWKNGRVIDIDGRRQAGQSIGTGINSQGHIVGNSDHLGPFIYRGEKMESLNALIDPAGRYTIRDVQAINDRGQIIGRAAQEGATSDFAVRLDPVAPVDAAAEPEAHAEENVD